MLICKQNSKLSQLQVKSVYKYIYIQRINIYVLVCFEVHVFLYMFVGYIGFAASLHLPGRRHRHHGILTAPSEPLGRQSHCQIRLEADPAGDGPRVKADLRHTRDQQTKPRSKELIGLWLLLFGILVKLPKKCVFVHLVMESFGHVLQRGRGCKWDCLLACVDSSNA